MNRDTLPKAPQLDQNMRPGLLDKWARKYIFRILKLIKWGRIQLVENGKEYHFGSKDISGEPDVKIEIKHQKFYSAILLGGSIGLAEAYIAGIWQCRHLTDMIRILVHNIDHLEKADSGFAWITKPVQKLFHILHRNTKLGSRKNILAHYDLGNDFYSLFLDETMTYSCGVFESQTSTLKEASNEKYDRICRKLKLYSGDNVIEIGTGWGGFAIYAAENYNCHVTTTTISDSQFDYARDLVGKKNLSDRINVIKSDYRDLSGQFDKLVSIEMIEAVGHEFIEAFFRKCSDLLKPEGMMALQAITITDQRYKKHVRDVDFIKRYIFPGSCLTSITNMCNVITRATDLRLVHLEDITIHYAKTLRLWREKFFEHIDEVKGMGFSEDFIRMWEYYLCYCEGSFLERYIGDVQMVFSKGSWRGQTVLGKLKELG